MRYPFMLLAATLILVTSERAGAQTKIEDVRVGFRPYNEMNFGRYKVGMWTPVYVKITAGRDGLGALPGTPRAHLQVEAPDFEEVQTRYRMPVVLGPNETETFVAYTKTGHRFGEIRVTLHVGRDELRFPTENFPTMEMDSQVYLALGRRVSDLPVALRKDKDKDKERDNLQFQDESQLRVALFEDRVERLPKHWFGYDGVDLIFLSTDDKGFLTQLADQAHADQLQALVEWVRRGGRLIIPMSKQTQELATNLLSKRTWQPPVPVVPPAETGAKFAQPEHLADIQHWAGAEAPFPRPGEAVPAIVQIEPAGAAVHDWDVERRIGADGPPLIARVRYGLGQIVYIAFSLDDPALDRWDGRHEFLRKLIARFAPRSGQDANFQNNPNFGFRRGRDSNDVTSQLFNNLDNFDVRVIPFGVVALFIVLYVVVVGPLEFILLKYVVGRMEWTWITFPTVVLGVSVIAYFSAYAIKGQDLKINQVDIVDFDLRSDLDPQRQPRSVRVSGQSFLMLLSPRIQSYTVGLAPNPPFWGEPAPAKPLSADVVSWMARPDADAFGGMGRSSGQGFFRKPYYYGVQSPDQAPGEETLPRGVAGVPIPVWMSKAFTASWEMTATVPPVLANLVYHRQEGNDLKISGTLKSNLAVDLDDVWIFYADRCYPIDRGLPAGKDGPPLKVNLTIQQAQQASQWVAQRDRDTRPTTSQGTYDPIGSVKQIMFLEHLDVTRSLANHSQRRLDFSWRLGPEPPEIVLERRPREAILVARVPLRSGHAESIADDASRPLPTQLWLGALPDSGGSRPPLVGTLNHDTFIRMILPLRAAGN
jgi:hypothetical protein